jgi:hypothetical protein
MKHIQRLAAAALVSVFVAASCSRGPSPEEKQQIDALQTQSASVRSEIAQAEQENARYSGGLIKALTEARIDILKTNDALIQQRILSIASHAPITVQTMISTPDADEAAKLAMEITAQQEKVHSAQEEASKYSGGLVQAMALSTAATQSQTLAMLEQRYLIAKFGLAFPKIDQKAATASTDAPVAPVAAPVAPSKPSVQDQIVAATLVSKHFSEQNYQSYIFFDLKFVDSHQWAKATKLEDMQATFSVASILYQDGSRRDVEQ